MAQLVDCVAYCIRRNFRTKEMDEDERKTFNSFFEMIEPKILKNGKKVHSYGLKFFPRIM